MLRQDGAISFVPELVELMDEFIANYEATEGPLRNDLERGLVLAYILGVMCCEIEAIWDTLAQAPVFGSVHPKAIFENCASSTDPKTGERAETILREIRNRGWLKIEPQDN
ncbi:MAG TPA: hypothetical protein GX702_01035 [Chloroflexi bacterium]|jgi:hypothetical protein|nr:hypothetical protein [Chloroflexota bacterium]